MNGKVAKSVYGGVDEPALACVEIHWQHCIRSIEASHISTSEAKRAVGQLSLYQCADPEVAISSRTQR